MAVHGEGVRCVRLSEGMGPLPRTEVPVGVVDKGAQVVLAHVRSLALIFSIDCDCERRKVLHVRLDREVVKGRKGREQGADVACCACTR